MFQMIQASRAWSCSHAYLASALFCPALNPIIFGAPGRSQPGTKKWDLTLVPVVPSAFVVEIPIATLDAARMGWSTVPL
jgi:hypothetical protein